MRFVLFSPAYVQIRVGVKYSTCTWYLYLHVSTYLSVLDVLEYLVYENVKVLVLVLVLDQKVLGTYQVIFKYYLLKSVKVANYLNTLLLLSLYLVPTTDSIVGFVASLA